MKALKHLLTKSLLLAALSIFALSGCAKVEFNPIDSNTQEVLFTINVPGTGTGAGSSKQGSSNPATRALTNVDENQVETIEILLFHDATHASKSGELAWTPVLANVITNVGGDVTKKKFSVRLPEGKFDIVVFANSRGAIRASTQMIVGTQKTTVLGSLEKAMPATGWVADPANATKDYLIPMWGEQTGVTVTSGVSLTNIYLHRMLARVDMSITGVDPVTTSFTMTDILIYNSQDKGRIVPIQNITNWDPTFINASMSNAVTGIAVKPSLTGSAGKHSFISYSSVIAGGGKNCAAEMYIFEAAKATADADVNAPCVIIQGSLNGVDAGWYRLDFAQGGTYLDILRNHKYTISIVSVSGTGYPTPEEALRNKSANIVVDITLWNDYDVDNVIANGANYIYFTNREVLFSQFGVATTKHKITVRSNIADLKPQNFTNLTANGGDLTTWTETTPGTQWTNNHFTVKFTDTGAGTLPEKIFEIEVTALPTSATGEAGGPDLMREATFELRGANLGMDVKIIQDHHELYRLLSTLDPNIPIAIDGSARNSANGRFEIPITSTHDYAITLTDAGMIPNIYSVPTGGTPLTLTNISKTVKTLYVDITAWAAANPRVSTIQVKHQNALSDAPALSFTIVQVTPHLAADIGGISSGELPEAGGTLNINVKSNVLRWDVTKFELNGVVTPIGTYLNRTFGSGSNIIEFKTAANSTSTARVFKVTLTNAADNTMTAVVTINHKGSTGIPADPLWADVLSYDPVAGLNLDGIGEVVYFKWGSMIGLSSNKTLDNYDTGDAALRNDIIVYRPAGYTGVQTPTSYEAIPYGDQAGFPTTFPAQNKLTGRGDPCRLITSKGGSAVAEGTYKMATGNPLQGFATTGNIGNNTGQGNVTKYLFNTNGGASLTNIATGTFTLKNAAAALYGATMVLPAAGYRASGGVNNQGTLGYYWSSTVSATSSAYTLLFTSSYATPSTNFYRYSGFAVRCVQ